ncbi:MAG: hypothetical protein ABR591_15115, partial [Candidatus Velthaea sp.]
MIGRAGGSVVAVHGGLAHALMPALKIGDGVRIDARSGARIAARAVAVDGNRVVLAPLSAVDGVAAGDVVQRDPAALAIAAGTPLLGRACDAAGAPLDGVPAPRGVRRAGARSAPPPDGRRALTHVYWTGVRAIDGPLAFARGARIGIFGSAGCGKSTLLEAIARGGSADATVVA